VDTRLELNGLTGTVYEFDGGADRWKIVLDRALRLSLPTAQLELMTSAPAAFHAP